MNWERAITYALWVTPIISQFAIAVFMLIRRLYRVLPCFFAYTVFEVVRDLALLPLHSFHYQYFYVYWVTEAICILLGIAVIAELFDKLFESYDGLKSLGTVLFRWATMVMVLVAFASAITLHPDAHSIPAAALVMERTLRVLQVGLLAFLFLFTSYFGVVLADVLFGVAMGFGLFGALSIVLVAMRLYFGPPVIGFYTFATSASYNVAVFIWAAYLLRRERAPQVLQPPSANELRRWNEALLELMHQ